MEVDLTHQKVYAPRMGEDQKAREEREGKTPQQAIVGFIDILGYGDLVNRLTNDLEAIKGIEKLLKGVSVGLVEASRTKLSLPDPYSEYSRNLFKLISVKSISDTMLITLPLSDTEMSSPHFSKTEILSHCIFSYLYFIAMSCTMFIGKTGLVVRGGIAIGSHYENPHNESLFIFSQAYINAYKLEQKADIPRILIDDEIYEFVKTLPLEQLNKFAFVDNTGKKCLDIYAIFENDQQSVNILSGIKEGVSKNMLANHPNRDVLRKLIAFARFHNERVRQLGFYDLEFDLS